MLQRRHLLALLVAAWTLPLDAQAPAEGQPTFKSGVDLVRMDVRIVDEAGRPITDITPEEVELYDQGTRLPIVLFQRINEPAGSYVDDAIRAATAEVSSNVAFPRGHLYILIFDQQHITPGNEHRARLAAEQFIRRRVRPSDRVAVFGIPGPGPQLGFTADKLRAIEQLSTIRGSYQRTVSSPMGTMGVYQAHRLVQGDEKLLVDTLEQVNSETGTDLIALRTEIRGGVSGAEDPATMRRVLLENARTIVSQTDSESRQFLQRLADVVAGFRDIEGRKSVVLFSEGFFQDNLSRELEAVAAAAAQSYCVFYTYDLNRRGPAVEEAYMSNTSLGAEIQSRIAPMSTLAVETGGMMILDAAARSEQALDRLADQAQDYYLIGFTPSEEAQLRRGQYRRVTVKVRRPGAIVSARTGYVLPVETAVTNRRRAIDTVLGAPFVQQGLRIDYTTYIMKAPEAGHHRVVLSLNADLPVRAKAGDTADVVFVVRDVRDGRVVASGTDTIPLPAKSRPGGALGTGAWRVQFNVPAGAYLMRAVVREPGGLAGSGDRRIDVRPLDGPDVTVSDLVVGSAIAGLPVRPRVYTGDGLTGIIEAYGRSARQLEGLEARMDLRRQTDGTLAASVEGEVQAPEADGAGLTRRAGFLLPLSDVSPGHYVAHAIVRAGGETVGERTRQVEVLAGRAPVSTRDPASAAPPAETFAPVEILQGALARRYVGWLQQRAQGTTAATAVRLAGSGRWEQVDAELRRLEEDGGLVPQALRGLALFAREDYGGAAAALQRAFDADPESALTAFFLGWAREGAGEAAAALSAWRSAAHLDPSLVSAHLALADGYLRLSQPELALQALRSGLAALPASRELAAKLEQIEGMRR